MPWDFADLHRVLSADTVASRRAGELVADAAWPITVALLALLTVWLVRRSPGIRYGLWKRLYGLRSVKAFGMEVAFLDEEKAQEVSRDLNDAIDMFKRRAYEHYELAANKLQLHERVETAAMECVSKLQTDGLVRAPIKWRATVHARHAFLAEHYLQLCRYVGPSSKKSALGRVFPMRWGIVGLTFRLREPQARHKTNADSDVLVKEWGLDRDEAKSRADNQDYSFVTTPLRHEGAIVGVFFVEFENTSGETAFTELVVDKVAQRLNSYFDTAVAGQNVSKTVAEIHGQVSGSEPHLKPLDDL